ncbi:MAG: peroxiredoxin family protein [Elusimicrobiota bacterium]
MLKKHICLTIVTLMLLCNFQVWAVKRNKTVIVPKKEIIHQRKLVVGSNVGNLAPDFSLKDIDGKQVSLKKLKGKVVYIIFWSYICISCRAELPAAQKQLHKVYPKDVVVLAFSPRDTPKVLNKFRKAHGITFSMFTNSYNIFEKYGAKVSPYAVIVDKSGVIRFSKSTALNKKTIKYIEKLIKQKVK